jgi:hypothetical protein
VSGKSSFGKYLLRSVKSVHNRHFPFFFFTITTLTNHYGYVTSLIKPASSSLCTSAFAASTFSSAILRSLSFLGLAFGLTCSWCSMTSLLTPTRSKVNHANTSLFLSRKLRIFACSCLLALVPMYTVLSGTLGSSGTFWNSPSAFMAFLHSDGGCVLHCSDCSHRKCTFLWPGAKSFSMFLASCWLPKMNITPKVAGTLRQRYAECKAALKMFRRPLPKMALYGYVMSMTSKVIY